MRCPHLSKDIIYSCDCEPVSSAPGGPYLRKYCKSGLYMRCPRYVAASKSVCLVGYGMTA